MSLWVWFLLLVVQAAAFSWVSRARNSASYSYHAIASVFSNGIWFISQFALIGMVARPDIGFFQAGKLGVIYVVATTLGSVLMHWVSINHLERGKRKVGA